MKTRSLNTNNVFSARLLPVILFMFSIAETANTEVVLEKAFPGLTFSRPVDFQHAGDGSGRVFIVEQSGKIYAIDTASAEPSKKLFLDITERVDNRRNEEGLLGVAFHPDFETNGHFFVDYTAADPSRTVISRFTIDAENPEAGDPASELVIMEVPQPYDNHNGGQLQFGPDGYLYIAFGDGGSGGDPLGNGQSRTTLLGSIARIDVDTPDSGRNYGIPVDNPFAGDDAGYREEIYAYGLRNPWRFSFDTETGALWTGDVGQNAWEEINIITKGANYGWNTMEGLQCYSQVNCDTAGLTMPVMVYGHSEGQSVTGGYVYRGENVPELSGAYVYADYVSGRIWTLRVSDIPEPENELLMDTELFISSFGVDEDNELYLCSFDNNIYKFVPDIATGIREEPVGPAFELGMNYPNPFNASTTITFRLLEPEHVNLDIFNVNGQRVKTLIDMLLSPGAYQVSWNGLGDSGMAASSGVYHYRLTADTGFEAGSMLLLK